MIAIAIPGQAWAEKIIGTSFETAMTENNKYIREKTIDECIACIDDEMSFTEIITNLNDLKNNV